MIEILLILILLCMFKSVRIFVGILFLLMLLNWSAHSQDLPAFKSDSETCACVQNECNNACIRKPNPDVVAALRKRFGDIDDVMVLYDGQQGYDVVFYTTKWHMACSLTSKPVRISKCRIVHA